MKPFKPTVTIKKKIVRSHPVPVSDLEVTFQDHLKSL